MLQEQNETVHVMTLFSTYLGINILALILLLHFLLVICFVLFIYILLIACT